MSIYRNLTWYIKGLKEFTKNGFEEASKSFNTKDLEVDLTGKVCIVTGANSGLGKFCAAYLSKLGAKIHMVCRNRDLAEQAIIELKEHTKNDNFTLHILDLSKPKDVYKFAKKFLNDEKTLDILINNMGCMPVELSRNSDNLETSFATNCLGIYILTETLTEALLRSSDPRVVVVGSGGMLVQKLDLTDVNYEKKNPSKYDGTLEYAQNKRRQAIMTTQWALKYPKIKFFSMHPGWVDTPGVLSQMPSFYEKHKSKLRTVEQGADTIIWLAASQAALAHANGEYFQDRKVAPQHLLFATTRSSKKDDEMLMTILDQYKDQFSQE